MPENKNGCNVDHEKMPPQTSEFPNDTHLKARFDSVIKEFTSRFKAQPTHVLRVPGRVNLIGEHVDYCGYSVCPMAIQQDIIVAFRPTENTNFLSVCNMDASLYNDYTASTSNLVFSLASTGWVSYVLCGVKGVLEVLAADNKSPVPMEMVVSGKVPPGSGLSSSSSLVCAGVLATALANKLDLSLLELADLSAQSESYIGTAGGGMDQAIIFLASKGRAKHIDFNPLRTRDVILPERAVFVVAHSLATKMKAASNDYNTRVVECRLATQILSKSRNLPWEKCLRLADFQKASGLTLTQVIQLVNEVLHEEEYTKAEVCKILGVTENVLNKLTLTPNTEHVERFKVYQRAMHVFEEARRVALFEAGCQGGCSLPELGALMSASHASLKDLYECSHPALDRLVQTAMDAGALGARLTGAGWGGCVVALTTTDHVDKFIATVTQQFYADNPQVQGQKMENLIFATQPGQGVQVFKAPVVD